MMRFVLFSLVIHVSHLLCAEEPVSEGAVSWTLYRHASQAMQRSAVPDSVIFCPYSAERVLTMAALGAQGNTQKQMEQNLQLALSKEALKKALSFEEALLPAFCSYQAVVVQKNFPLLSSYVDAIAQNFNAAVFTADFEKESKEACDQVNSWVSKKTENMIPSLLSSSDIDATTKLLLLNAVHFKKNWRWPFDPKQTQEAPFYINPSTTTSAMMMEQTARFLLHRDDKVTSVILDYETEQNEKAHYSCMFIQPSETNELATLEEGLSYSTLEEIKKSARPTQMKLFIPRCTVRSHLSLKESLIEMGITDAFTDKADFSAMTAANDLKIDKVIQESVLKIDEAGTEASSATAVIMGLKALAPDPKLLTIRFDRPFLVILFEDLSGQPLFIGRVTKPQ